MSKNRKRFGFPWFKLGILFILGAAMGSLYTPYPERLVRLLRSENKEVKPAHKPVNKPKARPKHVKETSPAPQPQPNEGQPGPTLSVEPVEWSPDTSFGTLPLQLPPFPPALPERVEPGNYEHIGAIANGINLRSSVHFEKGEIASLDRKRKDAYAVHVSLDLRLPHAANGQELLHANPELSKVFAQYDALMQNAKVSPWFHSLYLHKQNFIRKNAATLSRLIDRHNFFDTDTLLEMELSQGGRKVLWMQADMDVVSDGSDGDRLPTMPEKIRMSDNYQPSTSYRWKKRTNTPNPLLPRWQEKLDKLQKDKNAKADDLRYVKSVVTELKTSSFLLAQYDPFIVVPLTVKENRRDHNDAYRPSPGDYAVVVVGKRVFPAIVGDFGPRYKAGEASLRLCKEINPKCDVFARPVSDLGVSYLIFPGSKEPENGPIDYERLNARCRELLNEMGGLGPEAEFVEMKDLLPPPAPEQKG